MRKLFSIFNFLFSKDSGFTLLEILVVFSVGAMLTGVGLASYVSYSRKQAVEQAASNVKTTIEKARFNSVNRFKPSTCTGPIVKNTFSIGADKTTHKITTECGNSVSQPTTTLPDNVKFESNTCSVSFDVITGLVSPVGGCSIKLLGSYGSDTVTLNIDANGNVTKTP